MTRIVSVVGYADSGKTTYLEKLLGHLGDAGLRVAVIKHTSHGEAFFLGGDRQPPKDTDRLFAAGAAAVALVGPSGLSLAERRSEPPLPEVLAMFSGYDLILTEGYKGADLPRIEIRRSAAGHPPLFGRSQLLALVSDGTPEKPTDFSLDRPEDLAAFLLSHGETGHGSG